MIKCITGTGASRDHTIKVRFHPGVTNIDMYDYVKPELHHSPDHFTLWNKRYSD